jgi:hypothetical protein
LDALRVAGLELARERIIAVAVLDARATQVEFLGTRAARRSRDGDQKNTDEQTGPIHFVLQGLVRSQSVPQNGIASASMCFGWATAPTAGFVVRATDGRPYLACRLAVYWQVDVITRVKCSVLL